MPAVHFVLLNILNVVVSEHEWRTILKGHFTQNNNKKKSVSHQNSFVYLSVIYNIYILHLCPHLSTTEVNRILFLFFGKLIELTL